MDKLQELNWGIIGCGDVTEKKSGPAFNRVERSRLVAVMRRDRAKAEDYARRHQVPRFYDDAAALIDDPGVNAIYIATPPSSHAELAIQVAAAGKPCYVEKPMARSHAECQSMVAAFAGAELPLCVAYYRRALPHFQRVKQLIGERRFGELRQLSYEFASSDLLRDTSGWRFDPETAGGGLFWDLGSHALDLFDYWCGPLEQVSGQCLRPQGLTPVEELVALSARSAGGTLVSASWNFASPLATDSVRLRFDQAELQLSVFGPATLSIQQPGKAASEEAFQLTDSIQQALISNVTEAWLDGCPALSTGESAARTNAVIDTAAGC